MIASKGQNNPLEANYWYLPINHFHNELPEVKGKVDGFVEISRETIIFLKGQSHNDTAHI